MTFVADIHNHIAVKTYLYDETTLEGNLGDGGILRRFADKLWTNREVNVVELQTDLRKMKSANMNGLIAAHYVPEFGLFEYLKKEYKIAASIGLTLLAPEILERIEKKTWTKQTFEATLESIETLERYVSQEKKAGWNVSIPHDLFSLERDIKNGNTVILHSVEGAHHLGRGLDYSDYLAHLHELSRRGVCYLTLGHFFTNDFVAPIEGLPPDIRSDFFSDGYPSNQNISNDAFPMTHPNSNIFIEEMLKIGMIIDLNHTGRAVRDQVYKVNCESSNKRPLIFSHTGVQNLFENEDYPNDKLLSVSDKDILAIKDCGGVIGIIFYNYWLSGKKEEPNSALDYGIEYVVKSIEYIKNLTKNCENIAIGTDFDGMTDPPDDLANVERFHYLGKELQNRGFSQTDIEGIMGENMLRVLRKGWR